MLSDIKSGDIVRLKKKHPCGSYEWLVLQVGNDISIRCLRCHHQVSLKYSVFEHRIMAIVSRKD